MKQTQDVSSLQDIWGNWRGLGSWNFYFIVKFVLLWYGYLNFHPFYNLAFLTFLLLPVPSLTLHRCRNWIGIPIGLGLFYYDTWLPRIDTLIHQGTNLFSFSFTYISELLFRFINWNMIAIAFFLLLAYLFLSQWIRVTVFTIAILCWLNVMAIKNPAMPSVPSTQALLSTNVNEPITHSPPPTDNNLNRFLNQFYAQQQKRYSEFPDTLPADAQPFDILILQIGSLSWADINAVHLENHPLWNKFDILFDHFNSTTSYSKPAALRLLRSSCGQTYEAKLTEPAATECYLMDNLSRLGFSSEIMLDHDGIFDNFLHELRQNGGLQETPLISRTGISSDLLSFDGRLISDDGQLFSRWLQERISSGSNRSATYFNIISLHDGNTFVNKSPVPYKERLQKLLDQVDNLFSKLQQSKRKTLVIFIPEYGYNFVGDKLQVSGVRDIPSPIITNIPVGIKFVAMNAPHLDKPYLISKPSSYLALSDLLSRVVDGKIFNVEQLDLPLLTKDLPETTSVSENQGNTVIDYYGNYYLHLPSDNYWLPYPK